jgi:sporulation protein YlmC with PRC-barrel domain
MPEVLASALPEKPVLSSDGRESGAVHGLTMDVRTGEGDTLIGETDRTDIDALETTDDGHLRVPARMISGLDDHLIVSLSD